jgi:tetrahydrodipicolinate N-succinyltransferase
MKIGRRVWLGQLVYLDVLYPEGIVIGDNVTINLRTTVYTHFHSGPRRKSDGWKGVEIEDDVFIGPHCVVLPGVRIGKGAVIKAGSVLTRNVPPYTFWGDSGGGPLAQVTVPLTPDHQYEEFVKGLRPLKKGPQETQRGATLADCWP